MISEVISNVDIEDFKGSFNKDKVTVLDFYSPSCAPCRMVFSILKDLNDKKYDDILEIKKININENNIVVDYFDINSIPSLIFICNGKSVGKIVGMHPSQEIESKIQEAISFLDSSDI